MVSVVTAALLLLAAGTAYSTLALKTSRYTIRPPRLPAEFDGFTIVQLTDLHSASFGAGNARLLSVTEAENPDIIVLTGDMVSRTDTDFSVFLSLAKSLARRHEVYYILGNHEQSLKRRGRIAPLLDGLSLAGVTVLDSSMAEIKRGSARLCLYGGTHDLALYRPKKYKAKALTARDIEARLGKRGEEDYGILLMHNPLYFEAYAGWGADLTISGHVHGGVIRLPFIGALLSPEHRFFPKYSEGLYEKDGRVLLASRGLGGSPRLGSLPEVAVIRLEAGK